MLGGAEADQPERPDVERLGLRSQQFALPAESGDQGRRRSEVEGQMGVGASWTDGYGPADDHRRSSLPDHRSRNDSLPERPNGLYLLGNAAGRGGARRRQR